ncbi:MAG: hypothetical protein KDA45_10800 [Planctomycetales bacterium]|nr:hypothetical protein [Planctomycetales bacterium]
MSDVPFLPWIHIGDCPICVDGLCRVRACEDARLGKHLYAMCDECEALWLQPTTDSPSTFPQAEQPQCPVCSQPLYGPQAHWAHAEELRGTAWEENAIFALPSELPPTSAEEDSLGEASSGE